MDKFSCTRSLSEEIYYATLIAENAQQAKEMAIAEVNQKFSKSGGRIREWRSGFSSRAWTAPPASSIAATARRRQCSVATLFSRGWR